MAWSNSEIPEHWVRGQLLDLRKFTDGTFRACLSYESFGHKDTKHLDLANRDEAQNFVSWWYDREIGR